VTADAVLSPALANLIAFSVMLLASSSSNRCVIPDCAVELGGGQLAGQSGLPTETVSRILKRLGLNKLSALEPAEPIRRYLKESAPA
jgi:hypothetical protein